MNNNFAYSSYASNVTDRMKKIIQKHNFDEEHACVTDESLSNLWLTKV